MYSHTLLTNSCKQSVITYFEVVAVGCKRLPGRQLFDASALLGQRSEICKLDEISCENQSKYMWGGRWLGGHWAVTGRPLGSDWEATGRWLGGHWVVTGMPLGSDCSWTSQFSVSNSFSSVENIFWSPTTWQSVTEWSLNVHYLKNKFPSDLCLASNHR